MSSPAPPFVDLRSYLMFLESAGRLQRVHAPVDKQWEIACVARWAMESTPDEQRYAILFEQVKDHTVPVAVNLYASRALCAGALGVAPEAVLQHWAAALTTPHQPIRVETAPVQEVLETDSAASLLSLPVPVWTPGRDAGPYLSAGNVITKDPGTGVQNLGNFVEVGIDLVGQVVELAPGLAKVRRLVGGLQEFAVLPLDVIDDAPTIEASVQAD